MAAENVKRSRRSPVGLILTLLVTIALAAGLVFFWKQNKDLTASIEERDAQMTTLKESHANAIATLERNFGDELRQLEEEWILKLEDERRKQQEKLGRIYEEVNRIVYSSEEALDYIDSIEAKLAEGQALTAGDIEQLEMLGAGLTYVQKQYSKPIQEFKELETFLADQLGANLIPPKERYNFFQRIFGREYREAVREYHKDEGRHEAFSVARERVSQAYSSAQQQMAALASETNEYIEDIQAIVAGNKARAEDLEDFFANSRRVIDIHQSIMRLENEQEEQQEEETLEDPLIPEPQP